MSSNRKREKKTINFRFKLRMFHLLILWRWWRGRKREREWERERERERETGRERKGERESESEKKRNIAFWLGFLLLFILIIILEFYLYCSFWNFCYHFCSFRHVWDISEKKLNQLMPRSFFLLLKILSLFPMGIISGYAFRTSYGLQYSRELISREFPGTGKGKNS